MWLVRVFGSRRGSVSDLSGYPTNQDLAKRVTLTSVSSYTTGPMKPDSLNRNTPRYAGHLQTKEH
jgi:hypothetical protein